MAYKDWQSGRHPVGKGDALVPGFNKEKYDAGYERIFGKSKLELLAEKQAAEKANNKG